MVVQGTSYLYRTLSPIVPGRSAAYGDAANAGVHIIQAVLHPPRKSDQSSQ